MSPPSRASIPSIWIYAQGPTVHLETAVREGGGRPVDDPNRAEVIVWDADEPEALLERLHDGIRWVELSSAGIDAWFAAGVIDETRIWTAAKGVYAPPIAEFVVASILMLARDLPTAVQLREWKPLSPRRVQGATVGIFGAGLIGGEILRLLEPFEVETVALTRTGRQVHRETRSLGPQHLDELIAVSDYLVLAAPETAQTHRLIDAERLQGLKSDAVIINVGRGTI